ncbi:DUF3160 domain-containing protein [Sedimentibacter saalensis]|uniref:Uncharacterized protein DUF3160 n=1 Tax=Sedimentibacter saalensis TaxID=130788 RepID=A0A562JBR3_9FIRM|nr:DUF3160 domain-containing protein [Sedimentibacter saalensis]TWH80550.1 uncharacterized protein DUF3160 [Sedimentibacter saalensis]
MKKFTKFLFLIVVMSIFITSCSDRTIKTEDYTDEKPEQEDEKQIPTAWNLDVSSYNVKVPYDLPDFKPQAEEVRLSQDLVELFNAGQFEGFTDNQKTAIYQDGFVVLKPSYEALKMHHLYESSLYKQIPTFITVDSALHMYRLYFDNSLKMVESSVLYEKLENISKNMLIESIEAYKDEKLSNMREELKSVAAYFLTADMLLDIETSSIDVPEEVISLAQEETNLIDAAEGYSKSPITKKDIDYSQFTVRGHYAGNEKLEKYFKAMMWYGLCGFPIFDETKIDPELDMENLTIAMTITCLALEREEIFKDFENIYSTTALYTGMSDDLGLFELRDMIVKVYGADPDLNKFKDSSYNDDLLKAALLLPQPQIKPKYTDSTAPAGRQFRFMGQRYSFDAESLQNLMEPIQRPVPSGLDVVASLGSERAEEILDKYYQPKIKWNKYEYNLNLLRQKQEGFTTDDWQKYLYKGWLWTIKSSAANYEKTDGMPKFMRSEKWTDKNIHTALGSYAELKHDTILYMKQAVAEMGGGPDLSIPYNYVEPNAEVYANLKWLTEYTKEHLRIRNMLNEQSANVLDSIIEMQEVLMNVSVKELTNQEITAEENDMLYTYGGRIDSMVQIMNYMMWEKNIDAGNDYTTALVADIATIAPNSLYPASNYLEVGNGLPLEIYVVCRTNGKTYLARGALFNYYEFLSHERLTDLKWHNMLGIRKVVMALNPATGQYEETDTYNNEGIDLFQSSDYYEIIEVEEPDIPVVSKPEWTNSFVSTESNNVSIKENMELDWLK